MWSMSQSMNGEVYGRMNRIKVNGQQQKQVASNKLRECVEKVRIRINDKHTYMMPPRRTELSLGTRHKKSKHQAYDTTRK